MGGVWWGCGIVGGGGWWWRISSSLMMSHVRTYRILIGMCSTIWHPTQPLRVLWLGHCQRQRYQITNATLHSPPFVEEFSVSLWDMGNYYEMTMTEDELGLLSDHAPLLNDDSGPLPFPLAVVLSTKSFTNGRNLDDLWTVCRHMFILIVLNRPTKCHRQQTLSVRGWIRSTTEGYKSLITF